MPRYFEKVNPYLTQNHISFTSLYKYIESESQHIKNTHNGRKGKKTQTIFLIHSLIHSLPKFGHSSSSSIPKYSLGLLLYNTKYRALPDPAIRKIHKIIT